LVIRFISDRNVALRRTFQATAFGLASHFSVKQQNIGFGAHTGLKTVCVDIPRTVPILEQQLTGTKVSKLREGNWLRSRKRTMKYATF